MAIAEQGEGSMFSLTSKQASKQETQRLRKKERELEALSGAVGVLPLSVARANTGHNFTCHRSGR